MQPLEILETCLYVDDLVAAERFYAEVLGLTLISRQPGRHVFFRCGTSMLLLFEPSASRVETGDVPAHGTNGQGHVAFAIDLSELESWRAQLESQGVSIEQVVDWPQGGRSLYFRDPAGNSLELGSRQMWEL